MNENVPQAIALVLGTPGLGDGSSAKVPACELWAVHNAGDVSEDPLSTKQGSKRK